LLVRLGDDDAAVVQKMRSVGARDVTAETPFSFYKALSVKQRYYWWEMEDHAVVGILLAGDTDLSVVTIEIGEPGKGVAGIASWRTQKLTTIEKR